MKRERTKGFIMGIMATVLVITFAFPAAATSISKSLAATFCDIKIYVDGTKIEPKDAKGNSVEPFMYNGTTYLPVRAVGQAFGKEVNWDNNTKSVYIGNSPASEASYSRTNPAPIGTEQTISINNYLEKYTATMKITEIIRGDEAYDNLKKANLFNEEPEDGKEYILAKVCVSIKDVKDDKSVSFYNGSLTTFTSNNVEYPINYAVAPSPVFSGEVYSGGNLEGYIVFVVNTSDKTPKAVFGKNYDGTGGIWFKLSE